MPTDFSATHYEWHFNTNKLGDRWAFREFSRELYHFFPKYFQIIFPAGLNGLTIFDLAGVCQWEFWKETSFYIKYVIEEEYNGAKQINISILLFVPEEMSFTIVLLLLPVLHLAALATMHRV